MTELDPDVTRLLELLRYKIKWNVLTRFKIVADERNPSLSALYYQTASASSTYTEMLLTGVMPENQMPAHLAGEMTVNTGLIQKIFDFALTHEDSPTPFMGDRMIFYDVLDYKLERYQTFVLLFLDTNQF